MTGSGSPAIGPNDSKPEGGPDLRLALVASVQVEEAGDELLFDRGDDRVRVRATGPLREALLSLRDDGAPESVLLSGLDGGVSGLPLWYACLRELQDSGMLMLSAWSGDGAFARLVPQATGAPDPLESTGPGTGETVLLSRFAYMHRTAHGLVLESPLSLFRIELPHAGAATALAELAEPRTVEDWIETAGEGTRTTRAALLRLLGAAGMLTRPTASGGTEEDSRPPLAYWRFADLVFHSRSRPGRHEEVVGATYSFEGRFDPLPALKPPMSETVIPLERAEIHELMEHDAPYTFVQETRRSVRGYGEEPVSVEELGRFLYRVARVKERIAPDGVRVRHELTRRPVPGGGCIHELELYPVVNGCRGLDRGIYHYDPENHALEVLSGTEAVAAQIISDTEMWDIDFGERQIVLVLAARFGRMMWKYQAMAYASTLKNVGVLFQTMYLVATSMGLGACALGGGNSNLFARAIGTQFFEETSVGEFMLGSLPERGPGKWG